MACGYGRPTLRLLEANTAACVQACEFVWTSVPPREGHTSQGPLAPSHHCDSTNTPSRKWHQLTPVKGPVCLQGTLSTW